MSSLVCHDWWGKDGGQGEFPTLRIYKDVTDMEFKEDFSRNQWRDDPYGW